jgi:hypothetical protein
MKAYCCVKVKLANIRIRSGDWAAIHHGHFKPPVKSTWYAVVNCIADLDIKVERKSHAPSGNRTPVKQTLDICFSD